MFRDVGVWEISFVIILLSFGLLIIISNYLETFPTFHIVAEGGNTTELNAVDYVDVLSWSFIYGNFSSSGNSSVNLSGGDVVAVDAFYDGAEVPWLLVSNDSSINLSLLSSANSSLIDQYLGVDSSDRLSGTNTFNEIVNITFLGRNFSCWSLKTESLSGVYFTHFLESNGSLVYLSFFVNGTGFNGGNHDFQMLLPGDENYYFLSGDQESGMDCDNEMNFSIEYDSGWLYLNWTDFPGASYYTLSYDDNLLDGFIPNGTHSGIVENNFLVFPSFDERYYSLSAHAGSFRCDFDDIMGFKKISLTVNDGSGLNLISTPLELKNNSITKVLEPIFPSLSRVYWYDNDIKGFFPFMVFPSGAGWSVLDLIHEFKPSQGYWIDVKENCSLSFAGKVINYSTFNLSSELNLVSFSLSSVNRSSKYVLSPIFENLSVSYWYDNNIKGFLPFMVFPSGSGWSVLDLFSEILPYNAYYIDIKSNSTLKWPR